MDSLVVPLVKGSSRALREEKAFLRPFVALQKDVAERGRDPAVLILPEKSKASLEDATLERFPL